ncbi:MAG: cytochrome c biogenesis protein ResB [Candidatus Riflebacteria bacterium]|nr:cytochrome c biogenesis protein ResB [Candidatus Riflebacteria bacterium]
MKGIIDYFGSLKQAIFFICMLTLLAIIGTVIPQRLEVLSYINGFPKTWQLILWLGFDDMYRSPLFIGILFLLSASAIICVFLRWKSVYKKLFRKPENVSLDEIYALKASKTIEKAEISEDKLNSYAVYSLQNGTKIAFKSSGKFALIGGLILHIGLVLVFAGGLLGLIFGVEMSISGKEGEKIPVPSLELIRAAYKADNMSRKARQIRHFSPNNPKLEEMRGEIEKLHQIYNDGLMHPEFKVAFDKLWVEHYSKSGDKQEVVKSWNANLRFIDVASGSLFNETEETPPQVIKVNEPLGYREFDFYLANWYKNWSKIKLMVDYVPNVKGWEDYKPEEKTFPQEVQIAVSEPFTLKGFPYSLVISHFFNDFRISKDNQVYNASTELKNPACILVAFDSEANCEVGRTWAFGESNAEKFEFAHANTNLPLKFIFKDAGFAYEATMQMSYDPGKPIVWTGCFLFCFGMMLTFYVFYREEWIVIKPDKSVFIALNSNRSVEILKKELPAFENKLFNCFGEDNK